MNHRAHRSWIVRLLPFLVACSAEPVDLDLAHWSGTYLDYQRSRSLDACGGTYRYADDFVPFVAAELGMEAPARQSYAWLDTNDYSATICDPAKNGCAAAGESFSIHPWLLHELVHSVAFGSGQVNQPFFAEGLAVALDPWTGDGTGPRYVFTPTLGLRPDPRPQMTLPTDELHDSTAGAFVRFLLSRHGRDKFMALIRKLGTSRDMKVIRDVFREVYRTELDSEAELFIVDPPCTNQNFPVGVYDCTMPEVPWSGAEWSFRGAMDCDSEVVAGGVGPDGAWSSLRSVTLEIPAAGVYRLEASSDGDVSVLVGPCFGCPWDLRDVRLTDGEPRSVELEPGNYFVRMVGESEDSPDVEVVVRPE